MLNDNANYGGLTITYNDISYKDILDYMNTLNRIADKLNTEGINRAASYSIAYGDIPSDMGRPYKNEVMDVNVIVPNKVVEVTFDDGSKEKSVCKEPDTFSFEQAIATCIGKNIMGGSSAYNNAVKRGVKVYKDKLKKEIAELEEKERIARKKLKKLEYQKRRAARRAEEELKAQETEKERQIEIQKEAYIRAMQYMNEPKGTDAE